MLKSDSTINMEEDNACVNHSVGFLVSGHGYYHFGLQRTLPGTAVTVREALENISKSSLTPAKSKKKG